jgi:hypothetical protein
MAILNRRKVFALATETTIGTVPTLGNAQALFVFDPQIQAEVPMHERTAWGTLGELESVPTTYGGKVSFSLEIPLAIPAWASILLPACGYVNTSGVFTPTSNPANFHTVSMGVYEQGPSGNAVFKVLAGCMGNVSLEGDYGKPLMAKFEMQGIWQAVADASMITLPSLPALPPRFASATFTVGSYTPAISKFSLNTGNTITMIPSIATASGFTQAIVTARKIRGKIDPMAVNIATNDMYGPLLSGATTTFSLAMGSGTGSTFTIASPGVQYANVQDGNRDNLSINEIDLNFVPASGADTEVSIAWS